MEKTDCHWCKKKKTKDGNECGVLKRMQCRHGKCSFYETTEQFNKRQAAFKDRERYAFKILGLKPHE